MYIYSDIVLSYILNAIKEELYAGVICIRCIRLAYKVISVMLF